MAIYKVYERQTIMVAYEVEADDETQARDLVQAVGCNEFDHWIECEHQSIERVVLAESE